MIFILLLEKKCYRCTKCLSYMQGTYAYCMYLEQIKNSKWSPMLNFIWTH